MINSVTIAGNLTRDPELRSTSGGTSVCSLRIANNRRRKDGATGQWEDVPNYFDVTVWGSQGENCAKYLSKGRGVLVLGELRWREWETKDGTKRQAVDINAREVQFLSDGGGQQRPRADAELDVGNFSLADENVPVAATPDEDEIPF